MKLQELIDIIGEENIKMQQIDECAVSLDFNGKSGLSRITFKTDQPLTMNGTRDIGFIVWMPRDAVRKALAQERHDT